MNTTPTHIHPQDAELAGKFAALAHPVRLTLLRHLGERDACCVKELVCRLGLAQSTVSQHLKVLVDAGLVSYRADRQSSRYSLQAAAMGVVLGSVKDIVQHCCGGNCQPGARNSTVSELELPAAQASCGRIKEN